MANQTDVRRIALSLPETTVPKDRLAFSVRIGSKAKSFVWIWLERVAPKRPRVPNPEVWAVRVGDLFEKEMLLASDQEKFFTEPHYDGFPAVLVRLRAVGGEELRRLITAAWRCQAPRALVGTFSERQSRRRGKLRVVPSHPRARRRPGKQRVD
jgi:hypothetical protein